MKNFKKIMAVGILTMALGLSINNSVYAGDVPSNYKVAVVDIQAVVNKSAQVQALKKEQQQKMEELQKWLNTVRSDVEKQQTKEGKEKLVKKYDAEFAKKQEAIKKNYQTKLMAIDKSITETIVNDAKTNGYDLVLSKQGAVLYGGVDITQNLMKVVK